MPRGARFHGHPTVLRLYAALCQRLFGRVSLCVWAAEHSPWLVRYLDWLLGPNHCKKEFDDAEDGDGTIRGETGRVDSSGGDRSGNDDPRQLPASIRGQPDDSGGPGIAVDPHIDRPETAIQERVAMSSNFAKSLALVGISEGGYTRHKLDRGNYYKGCLIGTNHGISAPVLASWLGRAPTQSEMFNLKKSKAAKIYKAKFWDSVRGDDLPAGVDYAVFDWGVNSGPRRGIKGLQRTVGVKADGIIGPLTMQAIKKMSSVTIIRKLMARRLSFLQRLTGRNGWPTFGKGWGRRVNRVLKDALKMAGDKK